MAAQARFTGANQSSHVTWHPAVGPKMAAPSQTLKRIGGAVHIISSADHPLLSPEHAPISSLTPVSPGGTSRAGQLLQKKGAFAVEILFRFMLTR